MIVISRGQNSDIICLQIPQGEIGDGTGLRRMLMRYVAEAYTDLATASPMKDCMPSLCGHNEYMDRERQEPMTDDSFHDGRLFGTYIRSYETK